MLLSSNNLVSMLVILPQLNILSENAWKLAAFNLIVPHIRESVDSLCRDGADAQYMQYLSKSRITSTQIR